MKPNLHVLFTSWVLGKKPFSDINLRINQYYTIYAANTLQFISTTLNAITVLNKSQRNSSV